MSIISFKERIKKKILEFDPELDPDPDPDLDPDPDPLFSLVVPWIRIHIKMKWIQNTDFDKI